MTGENWHVKNRLKLMLTVLAAAGTGLLLRRRYPHWPCPSSLSFLLENPFTNRVAGAQLLLDRAGVSPGMQTPGAIRRLAQETGFEVVGKLGSFPAFTMNLMKPV